MRDSVHSFFTANLDYIYFIYGLALVLLAAVCFLLHRRRDKQVPWLWLALFAELHGLNEWLYMLTLNQPNRAIPWITVVFLTSISFLFLAVFGRRALALHGRNWAGAWITILLIVLAALGALGGAPGYNAAMRYSLGLVGGLMAARGLMLAAAAAPSGGGPLRLAAASLGLYAVANGVVVHRVGFFPASIVNSDAFLNLTSMPIQLVRMLLASGLSASLWLYLGQAHRSETGGEAAGRRHLSSVLAALLLATLVAGWFMTDAIGRRFDNTSVRSNLLGRAKIIAVAVGERRMERIASKPLAEDPGNIGRMPERIHELCLAQQDEFYLYLVMKQQDKAVFFLDCCEHPDHDCLRQKLKPGDPLPDAPAELMAVLDGRTSSALVSRRSAGREFLTAFMPIYNLASGRPSAVLATELNTARIQPDIIEARMAPIGVTLLACLLLITFFYAYQGLRTSAGQVLVAEQIKERTREELRESDERYRLLFAESPFGVVLVDPENRRVVEFNEAAYRQLGYTPEEYAQLSVSDWEAIERPQDTAERIARILRDGRDEFETVHRTKDGVLRDIHITVRRVQIAGRTYTLAVHRDVTELKRADEERRRLETQMLHAQKLESLGVLAGGIAHDFNNLLMGILGYAEIAREEIPEGWPARASLGQIETAAKRAADLTRQMLAYSGRGQFVVQRINLNELAEEISHLLEVSISKKCMLEFHFAKDLPAIEGDATQIRQVIMNLITNASDAIGDAVGVIRLRTGVRHADRAYLKGAWLDEDLPEGDYAVLEVGDTGCGMNAETMARIFDPFFTTKFTGRGLGLAAVLGIVRGHKGTIRIQSELGRGTTFTILLPCVKEAAAPEAALHTPEPARPAACRGTILVVDDEPAVRLLAEAILRRQEFTVLTAVDGRDGVEMYRAHRDEVVCVLMDMTMPHMDGEEAFGAIRALRPEARVVLSSGYSEQEAMKRFAGKGLAGFIQKPYRAAELVETIRQALAHLS